MLGGQAGGVILGWNPKIAREKKYGKCTIKNANAHVILK